MDKPIAIGEILQICLKSAIVIQSESMVKFFLLGVVWFKLTNVKNAGTVFFRLEVFYLIVIVMFGLTNLTIADEHTTAKRRGKKNKMGTPTASLGTVCRKELRVDCQTVLRTATLPSRTVGQTEPRTRTQLVDGCTGSQQGASQAVERGLTDRHALHFIRAEGLTEHTQTVQAVCRSEKTPRQLGDGTISSTAAELRCQTTLSRRQTANAERRRRMTCLVVDGHHRQRR